MKINTNFAGNLIILSVLTAIQLVFIVIPGGMVVDYARLIPLLCAAVIACYMVWAGRDGRLVRKGGQSLLIAVIGSLVYFFVMLITGSYFGFAKNAMMPGIHLLLSNLWRYAAPALMAEFLRYRLIKDTPKLERDRMALIVTFVFTFCQLDALRMFINSGFANRMEFAFADFFPIIALNGVLTFMAYESSLPALLIIRASFSLSTVLLPIIPNINRAVWACIGMGLLLVIAFFYHRNMRDKRRTVLRQEKRIARHTKTPVLNYAIPVAALVFLITFNMRLFSYFPVTVLTGSMEGEIGIGRGAVTFVERLGAEEVLPKVEQGDVILFTDRHREVLHRVIEITYNETGKRVYITKGDANASADASPVEMDQVLGISRSYIPYIGWPHIVFDAIFRR